jgi:hypothetical protein
MAKSGKLSFEKAIALVPLLAAFLALTYDIGYFFGIGLSIFSFFSLSEHILFAAQAIPFAILVATAAIFGMRGSERRNAFGITWIFTALFGLTLFLAAIEVYFGDFSLLIFIGAPAIVLILALRAEKKNLIYIGLCSLVLLASLALMAGAFTARTTIRSSEIYHRLVLASGTEIRGVALRMGERGIIFWEPSSRRMHLVRWGGIRSLETVRELNWL